MAQNIYDAPDFYNAYMQFIDRSSKETELDTDLAWQRLAPLLPPVSGLDILDLGCGSGWFCRWAVRNGAKSVLGLDISEKMLSKAFNLTPSDAFLSVEYRRTDLEEIDLDGSHTGKYGLVFSSLTLHYLKDLERTMALVHRVLKPGAYFVFNVEHPIYTAPKNPRVIVDAESKEKCWSFNGYYKEGERVVDWLGKGVRKQHRTITGYFDLAFKLGFAINGFQEFLPTDGELASGKVEEVEGLRPLFLMMKLTNSARQ